MSSEQNKNAVQITRKGLLVWLGLIFFVMAWMFILGIMVGRGTTPVPVNTHALGKELQDLKAAMLQKEKSEVEAQAAQDKGQGVELKFFEELRKPPSQTPYKMGSPSTTEKRPQASPAPSREPAHPPAPAAVSAPDKPAPAEASHSASAQTTAPVSAPSGKSKAVVATVAADDAPAAGLGRFTIQVGAFKDVDSAEQVVKTLRGKGYSAYHLRMQVPGKGDWFRVRVGAFDARTAAEAMRRKLASDKVAGMVMETR